MNTAARVALAAVAVLALTFLGLRFVLPASKVGGPASATPIPTAIPVLNGQPTLLGRYRVAGLPVRLSVSLPFGWSTDTTWVVIGPKGNAAPLGMAIRFYTVANVYKNPASTGDGFLPASLGPTVDDLVQAILNHPGWAATGPTPITVDGYTGQRVVLTLPQDAPSSYYMFTTEPPDSGDIWGFAGGQVFDISIVDVAGKRVVIEAFHQAGASQADLAEQQQVLDSIQLSPTP